MATRLLHRYDLDVARARLSLLTISGIPIRVRYGNVKYLRITVRPPEGEVRVSAPLRLSEADVASVVTGKLAWIKHARARLIRPSESGVRIWGHLVEVEVHIAPGRPTVSEVDGRLVVQVPHADAIPKAIHVWRKRELASALPDLLERWQPRLMVSASSITLRSMTTRWGTCNHRTGRLTFNTELTCYDPALLEYVVAHELAHLIVADHGPKFCAILDHHLPDWRTRRRALNRP